MHSARLSWFLAAVLLLACDRASEELPEWTPSDHDNQAKPNAAQVDTKAPRPGMPNLEKFGLNEVILAAWKQNCVPCHGVIGRGDGPQGAMTRPRDLTDPRWQKVAPDDEILHAILKGRGRMPAFPQIPEDTARGLVRLIRLMNAEGPAEAPADAPAGQAGAKPSPVPAPTKPPSTSPHGAPTAP